jgi:protein-S-isoprenylcysteine O-methyltransferase Ste14
MNVVIILGAMVFFGVVHSLTAGPGFKGWAQRTMGERIYQGTYRLLYNVFSVVTFAPVLAAMALTANQPLYRVPLPWAWLMLALQGLGALGAAGGLVVTDALEFVGLRQLLALANGDPLPLPAAPFQARGMYAVVRHPVYLFSLVFLWAMPVMSVNTLTFNAVATVYFFVGSVFEERGLAALYGDTYRDYQQRVPRIFPWPRPRPSD